MSDGYGKAGISMVLVLLLMGCAHTASTGESEPGVSPVLEIAEGRVGPVALNKPLPGRFLSQMERAQYVPRYVADGIPSDMMRFSNEGLLVGFATGPFQTMEPEYDEMDETKMAAETREVIRSGALIQSIYVEEAGPETAKGIGVGDTLSGLHSAYPEVHMYPVPPTLGNDLCFVQVSELPGVIFVFENCRKAKDGAPIVRVDMFVERDEE